MKSKKKLFLILLGIILVISFLFIILKPNTKNKKLKELNYNVTYKEAFPDENLRRGVVLCIMKNKCGEDFYNSGKYDYKKFKYPDYMDCKSIECIKWSEYYNSSAMDFSSIDLESKEQEIISKEDLEKIQVLIQHRIEEKVKNLQGIEYLTNLKIVFLNNIEANNMDFSSNKKLEKLWFDIRNYEAPKVKNINLSNNQKLKEIWGYLNKEDGYLDISNLDNLEILELTNSNIQTIKLPNNLKELYLSRNNIASIDLPVSLKIAELDKNKITNINLDNNVNLERLYLNTNDIEDINLSKLINLKELNLSNTKIQKETINFSNNPKLEFVRIEGYDIMDREHGRRMVKIDSLDFSNNPNLADVSLDDIGLKKINLSKNLKLRWLFLIDNELESLDLRDNNELVCRIGLPTINIDNNKITNLRVPEVVKCGGDHQKIKLKAKEGEPIEIPLYFNDKKVYLKDSPNFTREGDKYKFHTSGTLEETASDRTEIGFKYFVEVTIEVESEQEAGKFIPKIEQKKKYLTCEKFSDNKVKEMITNLPTNIKNFEVISNLDYLYGGNRKIRVRITFSDGSKKEFVVSVNFYDEKSIYTKTKFNPKNFEVIDGQEVNISVLEELDGKEGIDEEDHIKYFKNKNTYVDANEITRKINGLIYEKNKIFGKIEHYFTSDWDSKEFYVGTENERDSYLNKDINLTLLRDTDGDGIPDKDDDDKDGDGVSNDIEIANGSDLYNKNIIPGMTNKQVVDVLVNDFEILINEIKNKEFKNRNKTDLDNLKNNILKEKEILKEEIKTSYNDTTSDTELNKIKQKLYNEINDLKEETNRVRYQTYFNNLDYEISKPILENIYSEEAIKEIDEEITFIKNLDRETASQEDVNDSLLKLIHLKERFNKTKLEEKIKNFEKIMDEGRCFDEDCKKVLEEARELFEGTCESTTDEDINLMINNIDKVLRTKKKEINPKTGIKTYSLIILFIILISYLVFKKKKSYIR